MGPRECSQGEVFIECHHGVGALVGVSLSVPLRGGDRNSTCRGERGDIGGRDGGTERKRRRERETDNERHFKNIDT